MKKRMMVICLCLAGLLAGCGKSGSTDGAKETAEASAKTAVEKSDIDIDLTSFSSTMVYSEVYNMMDVPDNYKGKIIKMEGLFSVYSDETSGNNYYACVIQDAAACCAQGIEFVLAGEYSYPKDYPEIGEEITVVGVFDTYMDGDYQYCTLRDANLV